MTVAEKFGRNVTEARGWAGLSQGELGERLSLRYQRIGDLERGELCPRLDLIVSLAEVLELQVRDLLYGIE
jgi:ribosome-binding protein aMBF1 (putative translation factor)